MFVALSITGRQTNYSFFVLIYDPYLGQIEDRGINECKIADAMINILA